MKDRLHKVGVVTVTFNSADVLVDFLSSLRGQTHEHFHLYAIDNASKDDSRRVLGEWPAEKLTLITNDHNIGVAGGNNQGITAALEAGCDSVLLLNNDVVFGPELVTQMIDGFEEHRCSMTVPLIYYFQPPDKIWSAGGTFQKRYAARSIHYGTNEKDRGQYGQARIIEYAPTCCTLIKREVFDAIGIMDERYFVYVDDNDFMYRALMAGFVTYYLPNARLWHKVNSLTGTESPFSQRYLSRNRALFLRKHFSGWKVFLFTILYRLNYFLRLLRGKDDLAAFWRRQKAWSEGLNVR